MKSMKQMLPNNLKSAIYAYLSERKLFDRKVAVSHCLYLLKRQTENTKIVRFRHKAVLKYLETAYGDLLRISESGNIGLSSNKDTEKSPIWTLWWQGLEEAPEVIRICTLSKKKCAGSHPVILITKDNYKDYLTIPDFIMRQLEDGTLSITNLSDIIRVLLLEKYGGLWLDATILCINNIPEKYFQCPFYSCKNTDEASIYVSECRWTVGIMGGRKNYFLFSILKELFFAYCKKEQKFIDYFLLDYWIALVYRNIPDIAHQIDCVNDNNLHWQFLQEKWDDRYEEAFWKLIKKDTQFLYLSWKRSYLKETDKGEETFYRHIVEDIKENEMC